MNASRVFRAVWIAAGFALLLGLGRDAVLGLIPAVRELPREDRKTGMPWISEGFTITNFQQEIAPGRLPAQIPRASSWDGDEWRGRAETAWFSASRRIIHVGVAGYPQREDCRVWAEFRTATGEITRIECPLTNPREEWAVWEIRRPANAIAVRLRAEDNATNHGGWVAFSHPFRAWPGIVTAAYQHAQLGTTAALVLVLVWAPGLCLAARPRSSELRAVVLLGAGPLLLSAGGVMIWCAGRWMPAPELATALVVLAWAAMGVAMRRRAWADESAPALRQALAISALVVAAVVAKSMFSVGPRGELYRGTISRNFTLSDRIDSRFSFYVVQAAARRLSPAAPETEKYFYPWTFFSRGPLAGLAAIPIVFATGGKPPVELPEQRWMPFDPQGFAAYRVTIIVLSSGIIVAMAALLLALLNARWAIIGAGLLALSPFGVHEVLFTWPKWPATIWLAMAFLLAHARMPGRAGVALGIGFLFHPLALLWMPWIGLWAVGRIRHASERRNDAGWQAGGLRYAFGAGALVVPWMILGAAMPHLPDTPFAGQGGFVRYLLLADSKPAAWPEWWHARWLNFANTFIPLHLPFTGFDHFRMQSAYEPSGSVAKLGFLWWNTLPFGLGLALWAVSLFAVMRALRRGWRAAAWLFVLGPAAFLTLYWGMEPLGLLRECGHPLFVAIVALTCVVAARSGGWLSRVLEHRAFPWCQLPETWLMLWLTTLANDQPWAVHFDHLDWLCFALNAAALGGCAWLLARKRAETQPA